MKIAHQIHAMSFAAIRTQLVQRFINEGHWVHTEKWQAMDIKTRPEAEMRELLNVDLIVPLRGIHTLESWRRDIRPNFPWADEHFEERVCGYPINPGTQWKHWPWSNKAQESLDDSGMFNHNYMERYWPRHAGKVDGPHENVKQYTDALEDLPDHNYGIRWMYGDLRDVVQLLAEQPLTRQAYLPIFFPEDTGAGDGGRKPCTLGYQFIVRNNQLHIYYPMRSCDFYRHWADDVYMTIRLGIWVIEEASKINGFFRNVRLGSLSMHCTSLHMFKNDFISMQKGDGSEKVDA